MTTPAAEMKSKLAKDDSRKELFFSKDSEIAKFLASPDTRKLLEGFGCEITESPVNAFGAACPTPVIRGDFEITGDCEKLQISFKKSSPKNS